MSLPRLWGSPHAGHCPRPCGSPQVPQPCLSDSTAGLVPSSPQGCQARSKSCPGLSLFLSPGRRLMPKDGIVPVPPAACTWLGWQDRFWLSCLVSTDPRGQPPHPAGPWPCPIQGSITGHFFSRETPRAS